MISNYPVTEWSKVGIIETIYEDYETKYIRKSICKCYLPVVNGEKTARCTFYDNSDREIASCDLPNVLVYGCNYMLQRGLPLTTNEEGVILRGWTKGDTSCYSIKHNSIVWRSPVNKVGEVFVFNNLIYCERLIKNKVVLTIISAETGEIIRDIILFSPKPKEVNRPNIFRLDERHIVIYILGFVYLYNMENSELLMTCLRITEPSKIYWLVKVSPVSPSSVVFRFREFIPGEKIKFTEQTVDKTMLIANAIKSSSADNLPTNKIDLEREYRTLFGT